MQPSGGRKKGARFDPTTEKDGEIEDEGEGEETESMEVDEAEGVDLCMKCGVNEVCR